MKLSERGLKVFCSSGTVKMIENGSVSLLRTVKHLELFKVGDFTVMPFLVRHDAEEPFGYLIRYNPTGEQIVYATDTYYLKHTFPGVDYWIVECNHCEEALNSLEMNETLKRRLKTSHMSLRRLKDTLQANDLTRALKIVLIHLSDERSDEERMVREIRELTGVETVAAQNGMVIELNEAPF